MKNIKTEAQWNYPQPQPAARTVIGCDDNGIFTVKNKRHANY